MIESGSPMRAAGGVVDDDRRVPKSLEDLLESADHAVRLFDSATVLVDSGCLAEIDCLISDIGSRAIIEGHDGRLWFAPNTPRGAVFRFTLRANGSVSAGA